MSALIEDMSKGLQSIRDARVQESGTPESASLHPHQSWVKTYRTNAALWCVGFNILMSVSATLNPQLLWKKGFF